MSMIRQNFANQIYKHYRQKKIFLISLFICIHFIFLISFFADATDSTDATDATNSENFSVSSVSSTSSEIKAYLNQHPLIRIGITNAPGNGHQSAGVTVGTRLRQLGYEGQIQIIYDSLFPSVKKKLGFLFPPFDSNGSEFQVFQDKNLSFVSFRFFVNNPHLFQDIDLAIMGADDYHTKENCYRARMLLTLQPLQWDEKPTLRYNRQIKQLNELADLGYIYELIQPENEKEFIFHEMSHLPFLEKKISGLQLLLENKTNLELLPAYGHQMAHGFQAFYLLGGIQYALQTKPELFKGGVVVPLISNLEEMDQLIINDMLLSSKMSTSIKTIDIIDPNLDHTLRNLKSTEILLVYTGAISKLVFEYLYQLASLPPVVEGMNSIDLMKLIGKPYLPSILREGFHFEQIAKKDNQVSRDISFVKAKKALRALSDENAFLKLSERFSDIGNFILESKKPNSDMSKFFSQFKVPLSSLEEDQLYQGLLKTMELKNYLLQKDEAEAEKILKSQKSSDQSKSIFNSLTNSQINFKNLFNYDKDRSLQIISNLWSFVIRVFKKMLFAPPSTSLDAKSSFAPLKILAPSIINPNGIKNEHQYENKNKCSNLFVKSLLAS